MLSLCAIFAMLAQAGAPVPNLSRQAPLLVAEEVFPAIVMSVEDGDSVVLKTSGEQLTVDLAGVDAPELSQPGGPQAKQFLTSLTLGKTVIVRLTSVADRLARLELGGVDVTATLIRAGMGWHCPRYADERDLANAEAEARSAKRGLWSVSRPTPPWLSRGAGACWQQTTKPRVSSQKQPNFSGTWTAVSPSDRAGQKLRITQDVVSVTGADVGTESRTGGLQTERHDQPGPRHSQRARGHRRQGSLERVGAGRRRTTLDRAR